MNSLFVGTVKFEIFECFDKLQKPEKFWDIQIDSEMKMVACTIFLQLNLKLIPQLSMKCNKNFIKTAIFMQKTTIIVENDNF